MDDVIAVDCPSCGEPSEIEVDFSAGKSQRFTQDCPVCCRPWVVRVTIRRGRAEVQVEAE